MMKLTIVGCSGSLSGPDSAASSYLLQAPYQDRTFSLLLDCGPGAMGALYRYMDPREVDAIALSHLHADHCMDLCGYYVAARYSPTAPWPRRPIYAPTNAASRMLLAYEVPGEAYAIRVQEDAHGGGTMVYSGDTGPSAALVQLAADVDLLLVESSFLDAPDNPAGMHLSGQQAAAIGQAARVAAIVLTHIPPWYDADRVLAEATPHFDGPVSLAKPGAAWDIGGV